MRAEQYEKELHAETNPLASTAVGVPGSLTGNVAGLLAFKSSTVGAKGKEVFTGAVKTAHLFGCGFS